MNKKRNKPKEIKSRKNVAFEIKIYKDMIKAPKECPDQVYCTECSRPMCKHERARL